MKQFIACAILLERVPMRMGQRYLIPARRAATPGAAAVAAWVVALFQPGHSAFFGQTAFPQRISPGRI